MLEAVRKFVAPWNLMVKETKTGCVVLFGVHYVTLYKDTLWYEDVLDFIRDYVDPDVDM